MNAIFLKSRTGRKRALCLVAAAVLCLAAAGCAKPAEDPAGTPPAIVFADDSYLRGQIDARTFDVDGDGIDENCTLHYGPTSGVFSFVLSVYQDGELEYRNLFTASHGDLSFTTLPDGSTGILLIPNREGTAPMEHAIRFVEGTIQLTAIGSTEQAPAAEIPYTLAYVGGTDYEKFYEGALNHDALAINNIRHLPIFRADTAEDLAQFERDLIGDAIADNSWGDVPSFRTATAQYDEDFFRENSLLLVYVSSGNCTHRFGVRSIDCEGAALCVRLEETTGAQIISELEAAWLVILPVPDSLVANCTDFDAVPDEP